VFIPNKVNNSPLSLFHSSSVSYLSATWSGFDHSNVYHLIRHSLAWRCVAWRGVEGLYFLLNGVIVPTAKQVISLLSRRQVHALGHQDANFAAFPGDSSYSLRERHLMLLCANSPSLCARLVSQTFDTAKLRAKFPKVPVSGVLFLRRFSNSLSSLRLPPSAEVLSVVFAYEFPLGIARSYGRADCSSVS
jgi:hypothetical protein